MTNIIEDPRIKPAKGQCLCGKITIETDTMKQSMGVCHCGTCRIWTSGPFMSVHCGADVKISGTEHLGIYDSSGWAERGFCKHCGTSLFYHLKESGVYYVSSEIFGEADFSFDRQVFIDEKPAYYDFANETINSTGAEIFAAVEKNKTI